MILLNLWEHQNALKTLYAKCVGEVCAAYKLTRMELDILLFLANNPRYDTATDIIEIRYLAKSHVSSSISLLEKKNFLRKEYSDNNRKTAHLKICEPAAEIIHAGRAAQEKFLEIMLDGFSKEEAEDLRRYNDRMRRNINSYLKEAE